MRDEFVFAVYFAILCYTVIFVIVFFLFYLVDDKIHQLKLTIRQKDKVDEGGWATCRFCGIKAYHDGHDCEERKEYW